MNTAFLLQAAQPNGPRFSMRWGDCAPRDMLAQWLGKPTCWELICTLRADVYITPQLVETAYYSQASAFVAGYPEMVVSARDGVTHPDAIPLDDYDLIICEDPIPLPDTRAVKVYIVSEHWDGAHQRALAHPAEGYDLFLDHMLRAPADFDALPAAAAFPYLRNFDLMRAAFPAQKEDRVWVDRRTAMALAGVWTWGPGAEKALRGLEALLGAPVCTSNAQFNALYGLTRPLRWGDALDYLEALSRCRYYFVSGLEDGPGMGAGPGQGASEAASAGAICVGGHQTYHKALMHPACLHKDAQGAVGALRRLTDSAVLRADARIYQDVRLQETFRRAPLALLEKAVALKHGRG